MKLGNLALAALLLSQVAAAASVSIQLENGAFKVVGWQATPEPAAGWASVFTISTGPDVPSLFGTYSIESGALTFHSRYPLASGVTYHAVFHAPEAAPIEAVFHGPTQASTSATRVVAMYPSAPTLPDNQLKLYIVFSAPMQSEDIFPSIHLIDPDGKPSYLPFVGQELWNRDYSRLTLIFDPGRI